MKESFFEKFTNSAHGKAKIMLIGIIIVVIITGLIDAGSYYNRGVNWISDKTGEAISLPKMKEIPFRLGLDLSGGTQLTYKADMSNIPEANKAEALEGARDVIERRVNVFGVSEPIVQTSMSGDEPRIIVELAGVKDIKEAVKMIGETPLLEFKEQSTKAKDLTKDESAKIDEYNEEAEKKAESVLGKLLSGGDFAALAKEYTEEDGMKDKSGDIGWITELSNPEVFTLVKNFKKGEISKDLARTNNGFFIYKLNESRQKTNPFNNNEVDKEVKAQHLLICFKDAKNCDSQLSKEDALKKIQELKAKATTKNFTQLVKDNSTEPGAENAGGVLGWFDRTTMVEAFTNVAFSQKVGTISDPVETEFGYHLIYKQEERPITEYHVSRIVFKRMTATDLTGGDQNWANTELTGKNLKGASVQFDNSGYPQVSLEFDEEGAKMFEEITGRNIEKPVAIFLDGYAISTPTVNEKITGGSAVISGKFNTNEAKVLAQRLNAGALPVPIELINQLTVGATLGKASLVASLKAGLFGFLLVALFMIIYYRLPGLLSVFALGVYSIAVLAIFKIWPVTLTLSGIAGFILSIGMAVDANVLIFERLKEELSNGKSLEIAVKNSFMRAWPSIRDSNFTTLLTCFILIEFTTGTVKGFAITLGLGVLVSMLTAIVVTRNFMELTFGKWLENKLWLIHFKRKETN